MTNGTGFEWSSVRRTHFYKTVCRLVSSNERMIISPLLVAAALYQPVTPTIADLSWLAGCWIHSSPARTVTEFWLPPAGGTMLGMSRTVVKEKTTEYEFLVLRTGSGGLEYVAAPSGQRQTIFKATTVARGEVVFENPAHDFPTRITYRSTDGGLAATIDGMMGGKPRAIEFRYQRGDCTK